MNNIMLHSRIESQLATTLRGFIVELRLVDLSHYVSYIQMDRFDCLSDIINEASRLFFVPGFLHLEEVASAHSEWGMEPSVSLNLSINGARARNIINIVMYNTYATINLLHTSPHYADMNPHELEEFCCREIEENYLGKARNRLEPHSCINVRDISSGLLT